MREDEHADRATGIDEARSGDGLARRGRVLEAIAAHGAGVGDLGFRCDLGLVVGILVACCRGLGLDPVLVVVLVLVVFVGVGVLVVLVLVVLVVVGLGIGLQLVDRRIVAVHVVAVQLAVELVVVRLGLVDLLALLARRERGEHARERVDLVRAQRQPVEQRRLVGREHALEAEHEREAEAPGRARRVETRRHLLAARRRAHDGAPCPGRG